MCSWFDVIGVSALGVARDCCGLGFWSHAGSELCSEPDICGLALDLV